MSKHQEIELKLCFERQSNMNIAVQSFSHVWLFATLWTAARQASLSFYLLEFIGEFINSCPLESVMSSYHLILHCPLPLLPAIFPSIRVFSNELALHIRWPKYWSFSFSTSPFNKSIKNSKCLKCQTGNSMVAQCLGFSFHCWGSGSIPAWGTVLLLSRFSRVWLCATP